MTLYINVVKKRKGVTNNCSCCIAVDPNLQSDMYSGQILNLQRRQKNGIKHKAKFNRFFSTGLSIISKHIIVFNNKM